jgi:hypothetical protein
MPRYRDGELKPPPRRFTAELLEDAIRTTVGEVRAPLPDELGGGSVGWGDELDTRRLDVHERRKVAGYLAKYTTKSTEAAGGVIHPVAESHVNTLAVGEHVRCFLRAAFALDAQPGLAERRYGRCAHALGYRGHCLTKSRRYSTTFKALRQAREEHAREKLLRHTTDRAQRALAELDANDRITSFRYVGQGHLTTADALLAASAAARAREERRAARDAVVDELIRREGTNAAD